MADLERDEDIGRFCHELLVKLMRTAEGLLAANAVQGVWGTYGGLRRVCLDAEAILCHGIKKSKASSESDGTFWQFVQGLKWLSPSLASVIDKLNRLSQPRRLGETEMGRAWLRESVQDHTLMAQLDILIHDEKYLHNFYHDVAFLCQPDYVQAMRICFKAIELGKPALLSEINPYLLRSVQVGTHHPRASSQPVNRVPRLVSANQSLPGCTFTSGASQTSDMGNRHAHLNVTYSSQLGGSNLSLTVEPSLGASSLLHQKALSDPYFVSSLDSPGILENLRHHPLTEAIRNSHLTNQIHNNRLQGLEQNIQDFVQLQNLPLIVLENSESCELTESNGKTENSFSSDQSNYPQRIVVSNFDNPVINCTSSDEGVRPNQGHEGYNDTDALLSSYSVSSETASHEDVVGAEAEYLGNHDLSFPKSWEPSENQITCAVADIKLQSHTANQSTDSQDFAYDIETQMQRPVPDAYEKPNSLYCAREVELPTENVYLPTNFDFERPVYEETSIFRAAGPNSVHADSIAANINISDNSSRAFEESTSGIINSSESFHSVPSSLSASTKKELFVEILPETPTLPYHRLYQTAQADNNSFDLDQISPDSLRCKIINVKSEPSISRSLPLLSLPDSAIPPDLQFSYVEAPSPGLFTPIRPWADIDLYRETMGSPSSSPVTKHFSGTLKSSGNVYIPQTLQGGPSPNSAGNIHNSALSKHHASVHPPSASASRKLGHKRWVSDTSTIRVEQFPQSDVIEQSAKRSSMQSAPVNPPNGQTRRASEFEPPSYQGTLTKPTEGQSLMSYLTSQDFNTCANLEKENAHFRICEALIEAFESMKFNRMMKRQESGKSKSSSDSSSDEEIQELRQRIRIRKREKMMAKVRPFPSLSDEQTDTATNSQTASPPLSSKNEFSSFSGDSETDDEDEEDEGNIDLTNAELQRSNQQIEKNSSYDESTNQGSAESIAISLLRKFSEKHLPKASELKWLVSECDAPQRLLPLPSSTPVSPDDAEYADLSTNRTRLRGNLEWAPPRAQIIFSVHSSEKRTTLMSRQNFRCAGCGMRVDPAFMKRYRYCEYLGKYFCQCCHTGETSIIPGRVIEKWDFSRYPIANFSYLLLEKMWNEPLFHVDTINPALYKRVRGLESIRESRQQLVYLHSLLVVCKRDALLLKEMQRMPSHWISNDDAYSMDDFTQVRNGAMLHHLKSFISMAVVHVTDCQLCQGLGFICGMCSDQRVIFPFQLENVVKCQVCQACYHRDCFIPGKCPKCIRLEARLFSGLATHLQPLQLRLQKMKGKLLCAFHRAFSSQNRLASKNKKHQSWNFTKRKMQQEPLSPDSPEPGENDEMMSAPQNVVSDNLPS